MLTEHFPLLGLRLTTPRLELALPADDELADLASLAAGGVHAPDTMPFVVPWTQGPPEKVARCVVQYHWRQLAEWTPESWTLHLVVRHEGTVVGTQSIGARELAVTREVGTGSWLGAGHQGQGIGTEMPAAVLHLAFACLDVEEARSEAEKDNVASLGVSRKLGYRPDGLMRLEVAGVLRVHQRLRLVRVDWESHRRVPVEVTGLEPCLPMFGLPDRVAA